MKHKYLLFFSILSVSWASFGSPVSSIKQKTIHVFSKGLGVYDKEYSVRYLLDWAAQKGRVLEFNKFKIASQFKRIPNGAKLLELCLSRPDCNPNDIAKFIENYQKKTGAFPSYEKVSLAISDGGLYQRLMLSKPGLTVQQVRLRAGEITERLMDANFARNGWTKIKGEVGRNGIDGLYIKRDKKGNIKSVLIVESKYNKALLKPTKDGAMQMSEVWLQKKVAQLRKKYPNNKDYYQIEAHLKQGRAKYRLYRVNYKNGKLQQEITRIVPSENAVKFESLSKGEKYNANYTMNQEIDLNNPKNKYQQDIAKVVIEELNR